MNAYYLAALAPPIAALCGLGLALAWAERARPAVRSAVAATVVAGAVYGIYLLPATAGVRPWVIASTAVLSLAAVAVAMASFRPGRRAGATGVAGAAIALAAGALLAAAFAAAADEPTPAYADGAKAFQANCAVCHGPAGAGVPALAPPLKSYPAVYAGSAEGRRQLAMTVLYGLFGEISVEGARYDFKMPEFSHLDDATLAATLNFVVFDLDHAAAGVKPLTAEEVAALRGQNLDGAAVREHRKPLVPPAGP
ncbi:MAG: cytochrome c [Gammaproteobacteria bacterium]|nr:cytochrome c [Gammaproteobacteria bacterium]